MSSNHQALKSSECLFDMTDTLLISTSQNHQIDYLGQNQNQSQDPNNILDNQYHAVHILYHQVSYLLSLSILHVRIRMMSIVHSYDVDQRFHFSVATFSHNNY